MAMTFQKRGSGVKNFVSLSLRGEIVRSFFIPLVLLWNTSAQAQISPGELARVHASLEGIANCMKCHEKGDEITGTKCLDCHVEIKEARASKHGFHALNQNQPCISCHQEHLGVEANLLGIEMTSFDHAKTGYHLRGKHAPLKCDQCHAAPNVKLPEARAWMKKHSHPSYLGLQQTCNACHLDRHNGSLGANCQSCHDPAGWKPAGAFVHAKTKFPLTGRHVTVTCNKCHVELRAPDRPHPLLFHVADFADCKACHSSPHSAAFSKNTCSSCHTTEAWGVLAGKKFDHALTAFPLRGKHAAVKCRQCHDPKQGKKAMKPATACIACHKDEHRGEFTERYADDCARCHTEEGFRPSRFTLVRHRDARFDVTGAHAAIPCRSCHVRNEQLVFRFDIIRCETCHEDRHRGQFAAAMKRNSCAACHVTDSWRISVFDHGVTGFNLEGKHATASCSGCHKPNPLDATIAYKGTTTICVDCHADVHQAQFAVNGSTSCAQCHTPNGWNFVHFQHDTQSRFALTGAHRSIDCRGCHKQEERNGVKFTRFKPLSTQCESCHQGGKK